MRLSGLIGVLHLPAMPGDPGYREGGFEGVRRFALRDAAALVEGGVDGLIVENFGSSPFQKGSGEERIPPHQIATIALIVAACKADCDLPVGVNCLRNDVISALGIAAATGADFVRVNVHIGTYVTDQGLIEGEAHRSLRYRQALGAENVAICADVLVKHASPLVPVDVKSATHDTLARGHADAVIVTGPATGAPISRATLEEVRDAAGDSAVLLGSGVDHNNIEELAWFADGAIVGTTFKKDGRLDQPVDVQRVRRLADLANGRFGRYRS